MIQNTEISSRSTIKDTLIEAFSPWENASRGFSQNEFHSLIWYHTIAYTIFSRIKRNP